jgi:hypothetical protein
MHFIDRLTRRIPQPYKPMGAPGLASETWDPPSQGLRRAWANLSPAGTAENGPRRNPD